MLEAALPAGCTLVDATALFYEARFIKSEWEIANLRLAAAISEAAIVKTVPIVAPGITAADLVADFICAARSDDSACSHVVIDGHEHQYDAWPAEQAGAQLYSTARLRILEARVSANNVVGCDGGAVHIRDRARTEQTDRRDEAFRLFRCDREAA